jgi:hypothetical protein
MIDMKNLLLITLLLTPMFLGSIERSMAYMVKWDPETNSRAITSDEPPFSNIAANINAASSPSFYERPIFIALSIFIALMLALVAFLRNRKD